MAFDERKAQRVIRFIEALKHTKGEFHGKPFELLPWQEKIIRDVFGTVREDDPTQRQYTSAYIEIPKKNGKSELGAAIALNMLVNDDEWKAEVYSCAADRQQAAIVFDVAVDMVKQSPALMKRIKIIPSTKRMVYQPTGSIYQVLSSEVATKHAVSVDDSGNVVSTLKQISNDDVADVSINAGEKIIEGTITAATLNVNDIFANNAIIRSLIAANLDVDTLFAREATLTALNAMDITGNTYLKLMVAGKAEQSALDALEERVSNAELKITADAIVSTVTGSSTYIDAQQKIYDDMDTLLGYRLEILAETVFLSENKRNTTLTAHVWHGNTEVTDSIAAERFKWARESEDATADAVWNSTHQGFKSILVTTADVLRQASFRCELTE